jgi:hypothetical protein
MAREANRELPRSDTTPTRADSLRMMADLFDQGFDVIGRPRHRAGRDRLYGGFFIAHAFSAVRPASSLALCIFLRNRLVGSASVFRFWLSVFVRIFSINLFKSFCFSLTFRSPSIVPSCLTISAFGTIVISDILDILLGTRSLPFY